MLVYNRQLLNRLAHLFPDNEYHFYFNSLRRNFSDVSQRTGLEKAYSSVIRIPTLGKGRFDLKLFFDWEKNARETMAVYREVVSS